MEREWATVVWSEIKSGALVKLPPDEEIARAAWSGYILERTRHKLI